MKQIIRIDMMSLAKIMCVLHAIVGVVIAIIFLIGASVSPNKEQGFSAALMMIVILPLLNAAIGFTTGCFLAWLYNILAGRLGGIKVETAEI